MIGVDWGTSNLRAYRLGSGEPAVAGPGILAVSAGGFGAALEASCGAWLAEGESRVLLAGMVGSRQGWAEAPYLPCPADAAALAAAAVAVPFREGVSVRILPGVSFLAADGVPEVMRGEEAQIVGVLDRVGPDALLCLPGTHSKWVRLEQGGIAGFRTHMTGEAFAALRGHTILGRLMVDAPHDDGAFAQGVARSGQAGGLLHHLFGVRTLGLFGRLPEAEAASFLSGLLIGHEIRAAAPDGPVHLVGAAGLCGLYAAAVRLCGGTATVLDLDAAAAGLAVIGEHVRWT